MAEPSGDSETEATRIVDLAEETLSALVDDPALQAEAVDETAELSADTIKNLEALVRRPDSYRDALLVALATPLVRGQQLDIRDRSPGGRSASDRIGQLLRKLHIKGVVGAYQNIGKNSPTLVRGNNPAFDGILAWGSTASLEDIETAYRYVAASIAATARTVAPRPQLRPAQLTFARVMELLATMLGEPSGGAHEQYVTAALLEASVLQEGLGLRVETKSVSASDQSSGTSGDIEVLHRGRLQESIEVSANPWADKVAQADAALRESGLQRGHIVAPVQDVDAYAELRALTDKDISILDPLALASSLVALLDRRQREHALLRLYELLDEKLADPRLVNAYVNRLHEGGLAEPDAP